MNGHAIAVLLEAILCDEFGFDKRPIGTIFDADAIEHRMFCEDMILALRKKGIDCVDFENELSAYSGIYIETIPNYEQLFNRFEELFNE